ncbi:MAG: hypothetical protein K5838_03280 [Elusimicrobiales bacterium]|nr:hypothetical protein [Elusimicrobiales bacterium]
MKIHFGRMADGGTKAAVKNLISKSFPGAKMEFKDSSIAVTECRPETAADFVPAAEALAGVAWVEMELKEECPLAVSAKKKSHFFDFSKGPVFIAGPCSVDDEERYIADAKALKEAGVHALRAALFKPRSSPYAFQGIGFAGSQIIINARKITGLPLVTEVTDPRQIEKLTEITDVLQVGARNMRSYELLKEAGRSKMPVLLKRTARATLREWFLSAEYLLKYGCQELILCERGDGIGYEFPVNLDMMRTAMKETGLPIFADPCHSAESAAAATDAAVNALAVGANGLLVEAELNPHQAKTDGRHTMTVQSLAAIIKKSNS